MYVFFFEQIIRSVSGGSSFTLPYWNYTNTASRALPDEFTMPADPVFKYLYRDQRGDGVNDGKPIDGGGSNTWLSLQDMTFPTYLTDPGSVNGFCQNLDNNLHGNVHVNVGAQPPNADLGMTYVPTAANDPIFWLHHCNIDRIWASWNKASGANPADAAFREQPYTFADSGGHSSQLKVGEVLDTQQRGYVYAST
jgi:tyrosinase